MSLIRLNPQHNHAKLHSEMDRFMDRFFSPDLFRHNDTGWVPSMDVLEGADHFKLSLELPGLGKEDINITFTDGVLAVDGERRKIENKNEGNFHRVERRYGKFHRSFALPLPVKSDKIDATFKDGLLTIFVPKAEVVKPKEIKVNVS